MKVPRFIHESLPRVSNSDPEVGDLFDKPSIGDIWFNTSTNEYFVFTGKGWQNGGIKYGYVSNDIQPLDIPEIIFKI